MIRNRLLLLAVLAATPMAAFAAHPIATIQTGWSDAGSNGGDLMQVSTYGIQQTGQVIEFWTRMRFDGETQWRISRPAVACQDKRYMVVAGLDDRGNAVLVDGPDTPIQDGSNIDVVAQRVCASFGMPYGMKRDTATANPDGTPYAIVDRSQP